MEKSLLDLSSKEIIYFKNYIKTINSKFENRTELDTYFEKLCMKNFVEVCKSVKFYVEDTYDTNTETKDLDIFNPNTNIKLSPEYETYEKSDYIKYISRLMFFKVGRKIIFKNFDVEHFKKVFGLKVNFPETLETHFQRLISVNKFFENIELKEQEVEINAEEFYSTDNDFETWLGIPISKNNSKEFNQLMISLWLYVETPRS